MASQASLYPGGKASATASAAELCPGDRADRDRKLLSFVFVCNMGQKSSS